MAFIRRSPFGGLGQHFMDTFIEIALDTGVELLLETPGKKLIMEDGKVAGIIAENKDGEAFTIKAPVVILATGDMETIGNDERNRRSGSG